MVEQFSRIWRGLGLFSAVVLAAGWWAAVAAHPLLPSRIPVHFDIQGKADGWGPRWMIFFLPALGTLLLIFFGLLDRFSVERRPGRLLPFTLLAVISLAILFLNREIAAIAIGGDGKGRGIGPFFLPVFLAVLTLAHLLALWLGGAASRD